MEIMRHSVNKQLFMSSKICFVVLALVVICSYPLTAQTKENSCEFGIRAGLFSGVGKFEGASVVSGDLTLGKRLDQYLYMGGSLGVMHQLGRDYPVVPLTFDFRYYPFNGNSRINPFLESRAGFAYDTSFDNSGLYEFGHIVTSVTGGVDVSLSNGRRLAFGAGYQILGAISGNSASHQLGLNILLTFSK